MPTRRRGEPLGRGRPGLVIGASPVAGLYRQYHDRLWRYARRLMGDRDKADDVMQEMWERVLRRWPKGVGMPESPIGLLFTIVRNLCIDTKRREALYEPLSVVTENNLPAFEIPEPASREELLSLGLARLRPAHREVLVLYLAGYSVQEIARISGRPEGAVKSLAWRARLKLRTVLAAELERERITASRSASRAYRGGGPPA